MAAISEQEDKHIPVPKLTSYTTPEKYRMQIVSFSGYELGMIVIDPRNYFLYYIKSEGQARRYSIAVGKAGLEFRGTAVVRSKQVWPVA